MKTTNLSSVLALGLAFAILSPTVAMAVQIDNVTTTTALFLDDFEGGTVGTSPAPGSTPSPGINWTGNGGSVNQVTNAGTPGAYQGTKYVHLANQTPGFSDAGTRANFTNQTTASDNIRVKFGFQMRDIAGGAGVATVGLVDSSTTTGYWPNGSGGFFVQDAAALRFEETATTIDIHQLSTTTAFASTVVTSVSKDTWHSAVIDYNIGASTFTAIIDGVSFSGLQAGAGGVANVNHVNFRTGNTNSLFYFDAVPIPEPASMMLLGIGLVGLSTIRRRSRSGG